VIGRRALPPRFSQWNQTWGAPFGRPVPGWLRRLPWASDAARRRAGPFSFQPNNSTRTWEYPWAFHAVELRPGMRVVDVGGALSGLQLVLDRSGASVLNVDPFVDYGTSGEYAGVDPGQRLGDLNRLFGTNVELRRGDLEQAHLAAGSMDVVYCISTIEHLSADARKATAVEIGRVLRPGGSAVLTADLFLDLQPFTSRADNRWGTNIDVSDLVGATGLTLVEGTTAELFGFPDFDADAVQSSLSEYLVGDYPGLAQCLVLRKGGG
jgi:2-polyprenyl-3-methyl-5-hydroxy-6-metoxy-1,4-benzoquinol methylase